MLSIYQLFQSNPWGGAMIASLLLIIFCALAEVGGNPGKR